MKKIAGIEISFDKIAEERKVIKSFSNFMDIPVKAIWNWDWKRNPVAPVKVSTTYDVSADKKELLVSFLFKEFYPVEDLFELDLGIHFSDEFRCAIMVSDPSSRLYFIKVSAGALVRYLEDSDENGKTCYRAVQPVTYDDVKSEYAVR